MNTHLYDEMVMSQEAAQKTAYPVNDITNNMLGAYLFSSDGIPLGEVFMWLVDPTQVPLDD